MSSEVLPSQFLHTDPPPTLIVQGAEAHVFKTSYLSPSIPAALKIRPSKKYRHPTLDTRLTKQRVLQESRVMVKLRREVGRVVPAVYALDWDGNSGNGQTCWMLMEWIEGGSIRNIINQRLSHSGSDVAGDEELRSLMERVGVAVGKMHKTGVVHGDLTTSNLMLRPKETASTTTATNGEAAEEHTQPLSEPVSLEGDVVLVDFGLASQNAQDEDRAVDLYVLERAFGSTHPRTEKLFQEVLRAYGESYKGAKIVLKRLEEVRMRGRKRSMVG
jgi:TP53 regulating kinase-like protein